MSYEKLLRAVAVITADKGAAEDILLKVSWFVDFLLVYARLVGNTLGIEVLMKSWGVTKIVDDQCIGVNYKYALTR